jgi:hypothetical protein
MGPISPTEGITCPHGGRLPERTGLRAKRAAVPAEVWDYFSRMWERERQLAAGRSSPEASSPSEAAMPAVSNGVHNISLDTAKE